MPASNDPTYHLQRLPHRAHDSARDWISSNQLARDWSPMEASRVATLERQAPRIVELADLAGTKIEYLGVSELFDNARRYPGIDTDWILAPVGPDEEIVIPKAERGALTCLHQAGLEFPLIYVAHEIPKSATSDFESSSRTEIDRHTAGELIGPVPAPVAALEASDRLGRRTTQVLAALRRTLPIAGTIAAAPFVLVGSAIGGLTTLDPIVMGVIPAITTEVGAPAAWYILARWEW